MNHNVSVSILVGSVLLVTGTVVAGSLDKVQFIKIAPKDEKAVIKGTDGKLSVVKPGDVISENVTVKEIARGRIVLEERTDKGPETVIVRMTNDKPRIERLRKAPENRPVLVAPGNSDK